MTTCGVTLLRAARREEDVDAAVGAQRLDKMADALDTADTLEEILGHEGAATREYFQSLRRLADPTFGFEGRQRRPPPDPINAVLSYGYTLLTHEAFAALEAAGLDPMVGFLHRHRHGRPALTLDLMEEFWPMTVDVAVWRAISTRQIRAEQFTHEPDLGCRMGADARHAFLAAHERRMLTLTSHPPQAGECPSASRWPCRPRRWPAPSSTPTSPTGPCAGSDPPMIVVIAYDIVDDARRADVAMLLSGCGPRVQLSVFECEVRSVEELRRLRAELRTRIDTLTDQIRLYPTSDQTFAERTIIGARTVEERSDYWIVR